MQFNGFAELFCKTNYSFLTGASHPAEYIERAAELGLNAIAITDRDGVYGIPKAYRAAKNISQLKLIVGAELTLEKLPPVRLLARDRQGYGLLCRILSAAHADKPKGEASLSWDKFTALLNRPRTD